MTLSITSYVIIYQPIVRKEITLSVGKMKHFSVETSNIGHFIVHIPGTMSSVRSLLHPCTDEFQVTWPLKYSLEKVTSVYGKSAMESCSICNWCHDTFERRMANVARLCACLSTWQAKWDKTWCITIERSKRVQGSFPALFLLIKWVWD